MLDFRSLTILGKIQSTQRIGTDFKYLERERESTQRRRRRREPFLWGDLFLREGLELLIELLQGFSGLFSINFELGFFVHSMKRRRSASSSLMIRSRWPEGEEGALFWMEGRDWWRLRRDEPKQHDRTIFSNLLYLITWYTHTRSPSPTNNPIFYSEKKKKIPIFSFLLSKISLLLGTH